MARRSVYRRALLGWSAIVVVVGGVLGVPSHAFARQGVTEPWSPNQPRFGGPVNSLEGQKMLSVSKVDSGNGINLFITGQVTAGDDGQTMIATWKFDRLTGALESGWPRYWLPFEPPSLPPPGYKASGVCVLADGDGCVVVGVTNTPGEGQNIVFLNYNPDGTEHAVATWNNEAQDGDDYPVDMVFDGGGGVWVAGASAGVGTGADYVLIGFDRDSGEILANGTAVARFNGLSNKADIPVAVATRPLSSGQAAGLIELCVTGTSYGAASSASKNDIVTVRYTWDGFTFGNDTLTFVYNGPDPETGVSNEVATSLAVAPGSAGGTNSDIFVCGYTDERPARMKDWVVLAYPGGADPPAGTWPKIYPPLDQPSVGDDIPVKITAVNGPDTQIRVIVTGTSWGGTRLNNVVTRAYDRQNGGLLWNSVIDETDSQQNPYDDRAVSMTAVELGYVYLVGKRYQDKNGDGLLDFDFLTYGIRSDTGVGTWNVTPTYNAPFGGEDGPAAIDYCDEEGTFLHPDIFIAGRSIGLFEGKMKYTVNRYKQ